MEKLKEILNLAVEYCKNEPFHAFIIGALALFILVIAVVIITLSCKAHKAKKLQQIKENNQPEIAQSQPAPQNTENVVHETPAPVEKEVAEESPTPAPAKKEIVEEKPVEETKPEPKIEEEPAPISEPTPAEPEKKESAVKTVVQPKAKESVKTEKPNTEKKIMLHDALKNAKEPVNFYEEDESDKMARYSGKWIIFRVLTEDNAEDEMYFFELRASNGEKLLSSEEYTTYNGALRGIETHKTNILKNNFRVTLSKKGDYIFKLLSGKNMLLCMGEHYATRARCESAIESTKRFARTAFIDENIQDQVVKVPVEDDTPIIPPPDGYNGKWVIDRKTSPEGETVYYFELFANNGERLLSSEEYTTYIGAVNGIQTHKTNIDKGNFRISLTKQGDYIYKLLNANNQLLCLGEHYKTKRRCQNAVESVKKFALNSPVLANPGITK